MRFNAIPFFLISLACAPAQAEIFTGLDDKPQPVPAPIIAPPPAPKPKPTPTPQEQAQEVKAEADYSKQLTSLTQAHGLLEKIRTWQNAAEANPQAIITLSPENPKDTPTKPILVPAKALAAHGIVILRNKRGPLPKWANFANFPVAVEMEVLHARALLLAGQTEAAQKELEVVVGREPSSGTAEAQVWLQTILQRKFMQSVLVKDARATKPDVVVLPTWLGLKINWDDGHPVFAPLPTKPASKEIPLPPADQAQVLLSAADALVPQSKGEAQARAAVLTGDAYGLLGQWGAAQNAYGYAIALAQYLSAPKGYDIGQTEDSAPRGVPSQVIDEARTKQVLARRIAEMARLSAEFVFYRDGHNAMLHGDNQDAIGSFDKLLALSDKKRKESRDKAIAAAVAEASDAKRPIDKAKKEAEEKWQEEAKSSGLLESPFEAAAKVYRERCRIALGDPASMGEAITNLQSFIQQDKDGLYRGEALWTIAQTSMEEGAFQSALPWLEKLDAWVKHTRETETKDGWSFATLLPGIAEAAGPLVAPPKAQYTAPDFWGRITKTPITPGQLVNEKNAPWYLNHLEEMAAKNLGFLQFVKGEYVKAEEQWKRVQALNEMCADIGQPFLHPNDCTRLLYAIKIKRMMAYPGEENLFASSFNLKARVLHAEFLYITQEFNRSVKEFQDMLAADDKFKATNPKQNVGLSDQQRDFLWVTMGEAAFRDENTDGFGAGATSLPCWEKALEHISGTGTERRAALCYYNIGFNSKDPAIAKRAEMLCDALIKSGGRDEFVCCARFNKSLHLAQQGKVKEALKLLEWFEKRDGKYYDMAQWRIQHGGRL